MRRRARVPRPVLGALALGALAAAGAATAGHGVPEPDGYRTAPYDAPVPHALEGAATVDAPETARLRDAGAVVVDVVPAPRPPASLPPGQAWLPPPHEGVPGALWLPDTGYGVLAPVTERYLLGHLARATGGERDRDVVFYCRMDCWMSWNAARRALAAGYRRVHWFRDGIDAWRFEGLPTVALEPAPGERLPPPSPPND